MCAAVALSRTSIANLRLSYLLLDVQESLLAELLLSLPSSAAMCTYSFCPSVVESERRFIRLTADGSVRFFYQECLAKG